MEDAATKQLIVVVGPTAVGKTKFCVELAQDLNCEIVYADSRQVYQGMPICTAQPTVEDMQGVQHHLIGHVPITAAYDAASYAVEALEIIEKLFSKSDRVILSGGTGLYIDAICQGLDHMPSIDLDTRARLNARLDNEGLQPLLEQIARQDPLYYSIVDKKNPRRILRALEVIETTGSPYSDFRTGKRVERNFRIKKIGIKRDAHDLNKRIDDRMDLMLADGLLEEVANLYPYRNHNATKTIGCNELFPFMEGRMELDEAIALIKGNTKKYAKRQMTWFKRDKEIIWYNHRELKNEIVLRKKA